MRYACVPDAIHAVTGIDQDELVEGIDLYNGGQGHPTEVWAERLLLKGWALIPFSRQAMSVTGAVHENKLPTHLPGMMILRHTVYGHYHAAAKLPDGKIVGQGVTQDLKHWDLIAFCVIAKLADVSRNS